MRSLLLSLLLACDGKSTDTAPLDPTFSNVQDAVFTPSCAFSSCHGAGAGAGGLDLNAGSSYDALVDVASTGAPDQTLVIPGDPDGSYLMLKLDGDPSITGDEMPPGASLESERLELVRAWIAAGAPAD